MNSWRSWTWSLALLFRSAGCSNSWMPWTPTMPPSLPPVPRRGRRRRGRGGSSPRLLFLVVGVPVIFSDKFQQFLDRMVDIHVLRQRQVLTVFFSVLVQFLGKVVVPVLCNDRVVVRQCRKPCWCCSCSSSKFDSLPSCRRF